MGIQAIAAALQRVVSVLQRRPESGLHDDAAAVALWQGGTRVVATHANGTHIASDMPRELGGTGELVTPGWLMRAGFASCTATCIALAAADQGIELQRLEVEARSRSDARGLLGVADADGRPVSAGPRDVQMLVHIAARGVDPHRLRALVEESYERSPIACALREALPIDLRIDAEGDG